MGRRAADEALGVQTRQGLGTGAYRGAGQCFRGAAGRGELDSWGSGAPWSRGDPTPGVGTRGLRPDGCCPGSRGHGTQSPAGPHPCAPAPGFQASGPGSSLQPEHDPRTQQLSLASALRTPVQFKVRTLFRLLLTAPGRAGLWQGCTARLPPGLQEDVSKATAGVGGLP